MGDRAMETLLVTVLGIKPREALYQLGERIEPAKLAPVALYRLLPERNRPQRILALCTAEARDAYEILKTELGGETEVVWGNIGEDLSDHCELLSCLCEQVPAGGGPRAIIFDVTHGLRHFAFYTLLGIQYLCALRAIPLEGAYYAWLRDDEPSPLIDLRPLLQLFEWVHAVRVFSEAGDARALAEHIGADGSESATRIGRELKRISEARAAGLPLELGLLSGNFRSRGREFRRILRSSGALLDNELWGQLDSILQRYALAGGPTEGFKRRVAFGRDELVRQAKLIDDLLEHGLLPAALGLMDEWTVSWALLRDGRCDEWLEFPKMRRPAAAKLGLLASLATDSEYEAALLPEQRELGEFWKALSNLRNAYAHHGMKYISSFGSEADVARAKVEGFWHRLRVCPEISLNIAASGRLLVSAQGTSRGVLFSGLEACRRKVGLPDKCLVLCSEQSAATVEEACRKAGFNGRLELIRLANPYGEASAIEQTTQQAKGHLITSEDVLVNLTGGTTLMGLAVMRIAEIARHFARPVRRFGLIDPRPPAEQQADPYRASEAFWLDEEDGDGD
jgi:hypothetical protein